ncbi:hypothetical protein [Ralstonia pseudosolanacearum]|uniref:hypothetical protein n=1 Tax=Ralstonia pseudosolanacearum TaxID=1310165 RepID=UPI0040541654
MNRTMLVRALAGLVSFCMMGAALADNPPATGLGQAWPNAADASTSPHYHAYVFMLGGVKYVQINDSNGNIIGAIGTANGQFLTLPIGRYSQYVTTPGQAPPGTPAAAPTTVYQDGATAIRATPQLNGAISLQAVDCQDPAACAGRVQ